MKDEDNKGRSQSVRRAVETRMYAKYVFTMRVGIMGNGDSENHTAEED
jgi:hypothetical protein